MSKIELLREDLNRVLEFISRADSKAEILLSISGAMAGLVGIAQGLVKPDSCWIKVFIIVSIVGYLVSIIYSVFAIFPRLVPERFKGSHIYFDTAAKLERETPGVIADFYSKITDEKYEGELIGQIIENNRVAERKFKNIQWSIFYLFIAIVFTCVAFIAFNIG